MPSLIPLSIPLDIEMRVIYRIILGGTSGHFRIRLRIEHLSSPERRGSHLAATGAAIPNKRDKDRIWELHQECGSLFP